MERTMMEQLAQARKNNKDCEAVKFIPDYDMSRRRRSLSVTPFEMTEEEDQLTTELSK